VLEDPVRDLVDVRAVGLAMPVSRGRLVDEAQSLRDGTAPQVVGGGVALASMQFASSEALVDEGTRRCGDEPLPFERAVDPIADLAAFMSVSTRSPTLPANSSATQIP